MKSKITTVIILSFIFYVLLGYISKEEFLVPTFAKISKIFKSEDMNYDSIIESKDIVEAQLNDKVKLKSNFLDLNTITNKLFGSKVFRDSEREVVILNNGHLTFCYESKNTEEHQNDLINIDKFLKNQGIGAFYVQAPQKISMYDPQLPIGVKDASNETADEFLNAIETDGIDYIDLRSTFYDAGINQYDLYFKTDHHWNVYGAFEAYKDIATKLSNEYGISSSQNLLDKDNYTIEKHENIFLGSLGRRVGPYAAGIDDLDFMIPNHSMQFTFTAPVRKENITGDFSTALLRMNKLKNKDLYSGDPYTAFAGGDTALINIVNHSDNSGKKVLMVKDSFGNALVPFLAQSVSELDVLDLRHYKDKTIEEYILESNPDVVIFVFNPSSFQNEFIFKNGKN